MAGPEYDVLAAYPPPLRGVPLPLADHDGFSGARIWRVPTPAGDGCLRAWPPGTDVRAIHATMRRAALPFVPRVFSTLAGDTWVDHAGRAWDLTTWMPGCADPHPSPVHIQAACHALAELHLTWADRNQTPCPAVTRRLATARTWDNLVRRGWRPRWNDADPVTPAARTAWELVQTRIGDVPRRLAPWLTRPVPVQPCLCDVWHAHVLFTADRVTGLIDYGSVKQDHVAVDLARLLGSYEGDSSTIFAAGLEAYSQARPLARWECDLVNDLATTGTIVAAANWLRWLYHDGRTYSNRARVSERLAALVQQIAARP